MGLHLHKEWKSVLSNGNHAHTPHRVNLDLLNELCYCRDISVLQSHLHQDLRPSLCSFYHLCLQRYLQMSLKFEIPRVKTIAHLNNSAKPVGGRMKRTHVIAIFNCGAKRFLYKNMVSFGVVENVKQNLSMCHVGSGYHYYVTHSTVQKRSMISKDLQPCDHRTHNSGKLLMQRNWRTGPFGESLLLCTSCVVASRDAIAGVLNHQNRS